jgi:hypothetical protein
VVGSAPLDVTLVDPLQAPVPPAWDAFADAERLHALWRWPLLATSAWCATAPTLTGIVAERSGATAAIFHTRLLGLPRRRYVEPGRLPRALLLECRLQPTASYAGHAFAARLDPAERRAAVAAFEAAARRRLGHRLLAFAYRNVAADERDLFDRSTRRVLRVEPEMVMAATWGSVEEYLATLERKWRHELRRVRRHVDDLHVELVASVPAREAARLSSRVLARHHGRHGAQPPVPVPYFEQLGRMPGVRFVTYRDAAGKLLAYMTLLDDGSRLWSSYWGYLEPQEGGRRNLYFDQYLRTVELMLAEGRDVVSFGKGMADIKARYGTAPQERYVVVGR